MFRQQKRRKTSSEILLPIHMRELGIKDLEAEVLLHPTRKWRLDFYSEQLALGLEIEGGIWIGGAHVRPKGFQEDLDKYNRIQALGVTIFRFSTEDVLTGKAKKIVKEWMDNCA